MTWSQRQGPAGLSRSQDPGWILQCLPCSALLPDPLPLPPSTPGAGPLGPQAWAGLAPVVPRGQWKVRPWLLQGPWVAWLGSYNGHSSHQNLGQQPSSPGLRRGQRPKASFLGRLHPGLDGGKSQLG